MTSINGFSSINYSLASGVTSGENQIENDETDILLNILPPLLPDDEYYDQLSRLGDWGGGGSFTPGDWGGGGPFTPGDWGGGGPFTSEGDWGGGGDFGPSTSPPATLTEALSGTLPGPPQQYGSYVIYPGGYTTWQTSGGIYNGGTGVSMPSGSLHFFDASGRLIPERDATPSGFPAPPGGYHTPPGGYPYPF